MVPKKSIPITDGRMLDANGRMLGANVARQMYRRGPNARVRGHDGWLNPPTAAENAEQARRSYNPDMLGHMVWSGDLKPLGAAVAEIKSQLASLDGARRAAVLSALVSDIAGYGGELGTGLQSGTMFPSGSGSLSTGTDERPEKVFDLSTSATPSDINGAAAAVHDTTGLALAKAALTRDVARHGAGITSADLQSIQDRYWAIERSKQEAARGREYGKG
jgi:hypothetical protein